MANEFSDYDLPDPRRVYGSQPIQETTAAAIGEGLKGVASILDVGLKHSANQREKRLLGTVEDALAEQAKTFSVDKQPTLVGEEGSVSNPEDIGFSGDQWSRIDRLRQGNNQGRVSRAEFYAKTSSIVQQAIHDNPRFADSIRKRAQEVLGIAPTAAAVALEAEGQKADEDLQRSAKAQLLQAGLQRGIGDMLPDGTFDVDSSIQKVQRALATDAYLTDYNKLLDANIKYKQLTQGPDAPQLSLAERKDIEVRAFMGGEVSTGYQGSDVHFHDQIDSFFSTIPAALAANKNLGAIDQEAMIKAEIGQRRLIFMGWLNSKLNQVTMSPDSKEAIRKNYMDQFAQYEDWAKGGFSNFQRNVDMVKQFEVRDQKLGYQAAPGWMRARTILGDQVVAGVGSVMLATGAGTPGRDFLDRQALGLIGALNHGADVAQGRIKTSQTDPRDQPANMRAVTAAVDTTSRLLNSGQSVEPEKDIATFGNSMLDVIDSSSKLVTVDNLRGALKWSASSSIIQTLSKLDEANPEQAQEIAKGMMITNTKAVILTGQSITKDIEAANAQAGFQARESVGGPTAKWAVVYNSDTGMVEAHNEAAAPQDPRLPVPLIPPGLSQKIRDMNSALRANVALAADYGSDRELGMEDSALKMEYIKRSGIPIAGMSDLEADDTPENMPPMVIPSEISPEERKQLTDYLKEIRAAAEAEKEEDIQIEVTN